MQRRHFFRLGAAAAGAPAVLPLLDLERLGPRPGPARPSLDDPIRLSANENPLGIPDSARQAMIDGFGWANRYPGQASGPLLEALAERHGVGTEGIVLGNGSTHSLQIAVQAYLRPGLRVVLAEPTFEHVEGYILPQGHELELVRIPLVPGSHAHDLETMERVANRTPGPCLVYICNPNNPTGTLTPAAPLKEWIDRAPDQTFLVDEAYFELVADSGHESLDRWAWERPNVIVTRTFSKVFGLAGVRIGYAIARPDTASRLRAFNTNSTPNHLAAVAALAALRDEAFVRRSLEVNTEARQTAYRVLDELGLPYMESHTNFVLHRINGDLGSYRDAMRDRGVLVGRPFPPFLDHNRVSLGLPEEMERWAGAIRELRSGGLV